MKCFWGGGSLPVMSSSSRRAWWVQRYIQPILRAHTVKTCPDILLSFPRLSQARNPIESKNGLEGIFKTIYFQPPWLEQGHLPWDLVACSPVQRGLEHFQGWDTELVPCKNTPSPTPFQMKQQLFCPVLPKQIPTPSLSLRSGTTSQNSA